MGMGEAVSPSLFGTCLIWQLSAVLPLLMVFGSLFGSVSLNRMGVEGGKALAAALEINKSITSVE